MMHTENKEIACDSLWPANDLESVFYCPVCKHADRELLYSDLIDNVFRVAPGRWSLWKCAACGSAYLDPRPTPEAIYLAYTNYYTHNQAKTRDDYAILGPLRKLRRRLVNGYTNWRYGTDAAPSTALGILVAFVLLHFKKKLDRQYRHIPRLPAGGGKLLDVGCGDGVFLGLARSCGWNVVGLDPDPEAVANASSLGLTVHEGGIEHYDGETKQFDVITLNHVIEHVSQPVKTLESCHALLKPGGQIWLETPNIESFGHARFGKNWRGLEAPRHLIIFNQRSLKLALMEAGFSQPRNLTRPSPCSGMFRASFTMECESYSNKTATIPMALKLNALLAAYKELYNPSRREFLTVIAYKAKK